MKIDTQAREDHQVTMTVTLDPAQMDSAKHRAARHISERKSIPGFRPGKAPYDVMVRSFGDAAILEEAVDLLLDEVYPEALSEAKLEPGASGSLEKMEDLDKSPRFIFTVPLAPSVELGDYSALRFPYDWKEPEDKDVDVAIDELRQMYAKTEAVDRPIELGDFVLVDVKSDLFEEEKPIFERTGFPVFIRTDGKDDEWPFPGFSNLLVGIKINETKRIERKFPKNHPNAVLQGKKVSFEVNIKMIRGTILPDLNDEFAKQLGAFENFQALRESVKTNLSSRSKADYDDVYFSQVIDAIKLITVIKYAPQTLDHEVKHVMEDIKTRLTKQGMELAAYLKSKEMDEEKFVAEEVRPTAIKRLERSLLLDEISKSEKIEVSKELLDTAFQQTYYEYAGSEDFQKFMKNKSQPPKQFLNALAMESANRAYLQQTLERLKAIVTGQISPPRNADTLGNRGKVKAIPKKKPTSKDASTTRGNSSSSTRKISKSK